MTIEEKIINKIKEFDRIIIHRHQNADPDALGSQGGLAEVIKAAFPKKSVKVVGKDVKGLKWILTEDEVSDEEYADALVIVTDTANTPRIDDERYDKGKCLIKIDHHPMMMHTEIFFWSDPRHPAAPKLSLISSMLLTANSA